MVNHNKWMEDVVFFLRISPLYQPLQLIMLISLSELNSGILLVIFFLDICVYGE